MATQTKPQSVNDNNALSLAQEIDDRLSQELVIALVGPVGSGVSKAGEFIKEALKSRFQYDVPPIIKPSDFIRNEAPRVKRVAPQRTDLAQYIESMQTIGNALRQRFGSDYLIEKSIEKIVLHRTNSGGYRDDVQLPGRRAYIIDSIKNVEELELLRKIYSQTLCVVGVFAPDDMRRHRLRNLGVASGQLDSIMNRDQGELPTFGQMTRKTFVQADFFICNDGKPEDLERKVRRYLDLIFDAEIHTPTREESAMQRADAVGSNSSCLSRQVGAAIISNRGELIAVGWNDVPKFKGGLYIEDDQHVWNEDSKRIEDQDNRCFKWQGKICHNEVRRTKILDDLAKKISKSGFIRKGVGLAEIRAELAGSGVDALIEFSRSIHAEMEAILSVAREGRNSLTGATLYTTTYPCHNCARHIVAAGIEKVVYIEPYSKSLATALHNDAITEDPVEKRKVLFRQYDGVSPKVYSKLFKSTKDRKSNGRAKGQNPAECLPVFRIALDGPSQYESKIIADLSAKEQ